jgi:hypothetical protein
VARFSMLKNVRQHTTFYHAKNHNLTIKKPRSAPAFCQKPLQKPPFQRQKNNG